MATAAQLGLTTPVGTDYISDGDDAISNNAERLAQMFTDLDQRANLPTRRTVNGEDLNAATAPQVIRHTTATGVLNLPPWDQSFSTAMNTFILVTNVVESGANWAAQIAFRYGGIPEMAWRVSRNTTGLWQGWQLVRTQDPHLDDVATRRADLIARARARRGGPIGTAGLPAVALRFDHHTGDWATKVLPLLEERGLPWAQIINPTRVAAGSNGDTFGFADLEAAALRSGGEIWNHGGNHGGVSNAEQAIREIPEALAQLTAALPRLAIEGWAPPGLADGEYMGAAPFKTVEQNTGTYPGKLIMRNHAFVAGYAPGVYRTLDPEIQPIGASHMTIDRSNAGQVRRAIDGLGSNGLALMLHPNYLDTPDYLSTADLVAILDDIAARRDAGELAVLTYSGLWLADARSDYRDDLLSGQDHEEVGPWVGEWEFYRRDDRLGSAREVGVEVLAPTGGTVTVTVQYGAETVTRTRTVPASEEWQPMHFPVTLPLDIESDVLVTIDGGDNIEQRAQRMTAI